jgi:Zn-dependent protease
MERVLLPLRSMSNYRPIVSVKGRRGTRFALSWRAAARNPIAPRLPVPVSVPTISGRLRRGRPYDGCCRLFQVAEIPVLFHWSAFAALAGFVIAGAWTGAGLALAAVSLFAILLVRELGHAFAARQLGYQVFEICLLPFRGQCHHQQPYSVFEEAVVIWGGVAAQLILLVPAAATLALAGNSSWGPLNVLLIAFSWFNAAIMIINLIPARGMDGAKAWRLPLMILRAKWTMRKLKRNKILF